MDGDKSCTIVSSIQDDGVILEPSWIYVCTWCMADLHMSIYVLWQNYYSVHKRALTHGLYCAFILFSACSDGLSFQLAASILVAAGQAISHTELTLASSNSDHAIHTRYIYQHKKCNVLRRSVVSCFIMYVYNIHLILTCVYIIWSTLHSHILQRLTILWCIIYHTVCSKDIPVALLG